MRKREREKERERAPFVPLLILSLSVSLCLSPLSPPPLSSPSLLTLSPLPLLCVAEMYRLSATLLGHSGDVSLSFLSSSSLSLFFLPLLYPHSPLLSTARLLSSPHLLSDSSSRRNSFYFYTPATPLPLLLRSSLAFPSRFSLKWHHHGTLAAARHNTVLWLSSTKRRRERERERTRVEK